MAGIGYRSNREGQGMKKGLLLLVMAVALGGCSWLHPFSGNVKAAVTDYSKSNSEIKLQEVGEINGKAVILNSSKKTSDVNRKVEEKQLNGWQKFTRWLGNLSILTVLVCVGGLLAGTTAPVMFLYKAYLRFKKGFVQTVHAIDEAKAVENNPVLKAALSSKQDSDVKALVDDIQQPGS